jgi:2-polyprenyl-6-methoxyphenol hydroxylase-like FAD-dependent oxidoreductase
MTRVIVAGGSIAGLGAGVALHGAGIDVHVFERDAGSLSAAGAGLVVQPELSRLAEVVGGQTLPMTHCSGRRYLGFDGRVGHLQRMPQQFTSWEAVHSTLLKSLPSERYHAGASVLKTHSVADGIEVVVDGLGTFAADVLIAADGAQSPTRRALLPDLEARYAGYVAWRGTVFERDLPQVVADFFDDTFTFTDARSGGHALAYFIPGEGLATARGERRMNWVWYVGADTAERDAILVTKDGRQRHASLQRGMARDEVVEDLKRRAPLELHPMFARLVEAAEEPFLQSIVDLAVPRSVFERTVLIGDAAVIVRPHTAGGAAKAARDAIFLAELLASPRLSTDEALARFEREQLAYGRELLEYGVKLGKQWARL